MSKPLLTVNAGVYLLKWEPEQITMRIDRIREDKVNVTGEVTVKTTLPGIADHLHQARLNLTSTTARRTVSSHLKTRLDTLDWDAMVEQACVKVLEHYRQGEPVILVWNLERTNSEDFLVFPMIRLQEPTLVYADGGSGKSTVGALIAVMVQAGYPGIKGLPVKYSGNVLWLDYEASADEVDERVKQIRPALGISDAVQLYYRYCSQPLSDEIEEIQRIVAELDITLIVIDSLALACGGEPEKTE